MSSSPVLYVYYRPENDDAYPGIPARHITEADWASFTFQQRRTVEDAVTQEGYTRRKVWLHRDLVDETEEERAQREAAEQAAREAYERGNSLVRYREIENILSTVDAVADVPAQVAKGDKALSLKSGYYQPAADGVTDDRAKLQALLDDGAGGTVTIAKGTYAIVGPLVPRASTEIVIQPGTVIEQKTRNTPVFDILDADDVVIWGNGALLTWTGTRTFLNSPEYRGENGDVYGAAVWSNSHRTKIHDLRVHGFICGVHINGWNGTTLADAAKRGNEVHNVEVDRVDFGLLMSGQVRPRIRGLHGVIEKSAGGPPAHMIYTTNRHNAFCHDLDIDGAACLNNPDIGAFQFKNVKGGRATGLVARRSNGTLSLQGVTGMAIQVVHNDDIATDANNTEGSIYFLDASNHNNVIDAVILADPATTGNRIARIDGTGNRVTLRARQRVTTTSASQYAVWVVGSKNLVDVSLENLDASGAEMATGRVAVHVTGHDNEIVVRRARNYHDAVSIATGANRNHVTVIGTQYQRASGISARGAVQNKGSATTIARPAHAYATMSGPAGAAVRPDATIFSSVDVNVTTNDAWNMWNYGPGAERIPVGSRFSVTIRNTSGGAMGAVTWLDYTLRSAWTPPANGAAVTIDFVYDGFAFKEIGRTA